MGNAATAYTEAVGGASMYKNVVDWTQTVGDSNPKQSTPSTEHINTNKQTV